MNPFACDGERREDELTYIGSLIWLKNVKQAGGLLSEIFHRHSGWRHRGFSDSEARPSFISVRATRVSCSQRSPSRRLPPAR
jgi:hypothetical protein